MEGASEELLRPVSAEAPCGPDARELAGFDELRRKIEDVDKAAGADQIAWPREQARILELARQCHDLRVWSWLARSRLATEGLAGFAEGLELIAAGVERYWDILPPYDPEDSNPRERFMGRLVALSFIGGSSFQTTDRDLLGRRSTLHFLKDVEGAAARAAAGSDGPALAQRVRLALAAVEGLFKQRFGPGNDPQLGFAQVVQRLADLQAARAAAPPTNGAEAPAAAPVTVANGAVGSRADVVAALDRVLDYYARHEPSSPVPLLVGRAKRLVSMSFFEAIKELAPSGLKELQTLAGSGDEAKR